jgi:hypothetical protein
MIKDPTRAQSENVQTVVSRMANKRIIIPDYQRDAEQWDARKESLFIESLLNNLTIPAFFFAEQPDGKIEVVDGQQRLTTIQKYAENEFPISDDDDMVYLTPQSVQYRGKNFKKLSDELRNVFNDYPLTIIYLPKNITLSAKLEIFRRINEGGTPLSPQDIRLSYYSESVSVAFIRLAGVYKRSDSASRMLEYAKKKGIAEDPWAKHSNAFGLWADWWEEKVKAKGQTPSEMFLWYLIQRYRDPVDALCNKPDAMKHLALGFRGTTEEVLDIFCAQLQYTDANGGAAILPSVTQLSGEFESFVAWLQHILSLGMAGMGVDKYKQMALLVGAAVELKLEPAKVSNDQWDAIAAFIRQPRIAGTQWLGQGGYPEPKGRWGGQKGQKAQCDSAVKLLSVLTTKVK